jgi:cation:H+ antiporter
MEFSTILFLILGLSLLLFSGKYLVESSVVIARQFNIPSGIIGLTIVAFGTSAPELLVSIQAAMHGYPDMAVGNVIGSNISNILLVLGLTALIFPLTIQRSSVLVDWPIMFFLSLLLLVFLLDSQLTRLEGALFVLLILFYILFSIRQARRSVPPEVEKANVLQKTPWWVTALIFLVACTGLTFGASLLVDSAAEMAHFFGISERVISITMVALGTSLPELVTSLIAAIKKEMEISVGNILGSNIMNIASVLGITALIQPISTVAEVLRIDIPWMIGSALLLFVFMLPLRKGRITRLQGAIMFIAYTSYIYFIFIS